MSKSFFLVMIMFSFSWAVSGQIKEKMHMGIGVGFDYGGLGTRLTYRVSPALGAFGALGYNFDGLGYNVGVQVRDQASERLSVFANAMYGYNAVLLIKGPQGNVKTTYFGPSIGVGFQRKRKRNENFWSSELIYPFRSKTAFNAIDDLRSAGYTVNTFVPLAFSVGYHIKLK